MLEIQGLATDIGARSINQGLLQTEITISFIKNFTKMRNTQRSTSTK